jgi:hypothetical protein
VVGGELAISWVIVLRVEGGAISRRAFRPFAGVGWAENCRMPNARSVFEMEAESRIDQIEESERERGAPRGGGERENVRG